MTNKSIILPGDTSLNCHIAWSTRADGPMNLIGKEYPLSSFPHSLTLESRLPVEINAGDTERRANRASFFSRLTTSRDISAVIPKLQHGATVSYVSEPNAFIDDLLCDALTTDAPYLALTVGFADCVPVVLFDPATHALAVVHAGWKGIAAGVLEATMNQMLSLGAQRSRLSAFVGPGAKRCCYEVSPEVATAVDGLSHVGHAKIDLPSIVTMRLVARGVPIENIRCEDVCTICGVDSKSQKPLYFSYRREKKADPLDTGILIAWME